MTPNSPNLLLDLSRATSEHAVTTLIEHATAMGASDLFLVSNEQHVAAQVRHHGLVRAIAILGAEQGKKCISHIKASAGIDMNSRVPADGRWIFTPKGNEDESIDLRINSIPTLYGEDLAIRILQRSNRLFTVENLGMTRKQLAGFEMMISSPGGLILITGPTGSGKTATLYATLQRLNDGKRKIHTIEDPIEFSIDGTRQSQVNPAIDVTFGKLLRAVLRQSPDVIMIGEIRDAETAQVAVQAANSGILVLATLHAPNAVSAIQSLRSLGVAQHFLASALRGVISQRLVRTLDPNTRKAVSGISEGFDPFEEVRSMLSPEEGQSLFVPVGTDANQHTGYAGRTGVFEVLTMTKDLRNLIAEGRPTSELRQKAMEENMLPFRQAALIKVARGETTSEEIFRVVPSDQITAEE